MQKNKLSNDSDLKRFGRLLVWIRKSFVGLCLSGTSCLKQQCVNEGKAPQEGNCSVTVLSQQPPLIKWCSCRNTWGNKGLTVWHKTTKYVWEAKWGINPLRLSSRHRSCRSCLSQHRRLSVCLDWVNSFVWVRPWCDQGWVGNKTNFHPWAAPHSLHLIRTFEWILQITMPSVGPNKPQRSSVSSALPLLLLL